MSKLFVTKKNLETLIKNLKSECDEFIAPKREYLDDVIFGDTKNDSAELLDYEGNSVVSPRAFLLPQTEPLFEIKSAKGSALIPVKDNRKRIFYGIRPCDINALTMMRSFFLDKFIDIAYRQKLCNSYFIALACNKRCSPESFCYQIGSGPAAKDGFDLQLVSIDRGFLVEAGSKKGRQIIKQNKRLFAGAKAQDEKKAKDILKDFIKGLKRIDYKKIARAMKQDKIKEAAWTDIGLRCVVCSGCITLCPTCTCFSIADRLSGDTGVRLRYCDGCVFSGFTRMAGSNTPFPLHRDHIRRFFEHKLNVDVDRYTRPSCVGCARCTQTCPGNINIRKFIEEAA